MAGDGDDDDGGEVMMMGLSACCGRPKSLISQNVTFLPYFEF